MERDSEPTLPFGQLISQCSKYLRIYIDVVYLESLDEFQYLVDPF